MSELASSRDEAAVGPADPGADLLKVHWFLPTGGDGRQIVPSAGSEWRDPSIDYLAQIARAADQLGFDALLTPCGTACEDAWVATAALIPLTRHVRFLVAFRPGLLSPTLAAQMASTYQRLSGGRLLLNIVTGAEAAELARFGERRDKNTRYRATGEFLRVLRGALSGTPLDHSGEFYDVAGATTRSVPQPAPEIYFGGASSDAVEVAAAQADVYLLWGEPPEAARARIDAVRSAAASLGRTVRFGIRFHAISRDTSEAAWAEADRLLAGIDPATIEAARADFATSASEGQRRMQELAHRNDSLVVHPNVWAGIGLVRGGAGTALVGSHQEIADRVEEYIGVGISEFILSGYPHLEEAYWVGEGLLPELRRRGLLGPPAGGGPRGPISTFR